MPENFNFSYPTEEFNLERCAGSGQVFRWERLADGTWIGIDGPRWYAVEVVPNPSESKSRYRVSTNASETEFGSLFQLGLSAKAIEEVILSRGPELQPTLGALRGLRITRQFDPAETLFTFVCTANNHLARITRMVRSLAALGDPIEDAPESAHRFPTIDRIAALDEQDLRSLGFGYRAAILPRLARELMHRPVGWLESLRGASYEEAHWELCRLHGVGPKLADCVALFGLHHRRAVPIDTHMWQVACRLYFPEWRGTSLTPAKYRHFGDFFRARFGDLAGWAHQFLFLDSVLAGRARKPNV